MGKSIGEKKEGFLSWDFSLLKSGRWKFAACRNMIVCIYHRLSNGYDEWLRTVVGPRYIVEQWLITRLVVTHCFLKHMKLARQLPWTGYTYMIKSRDYAWMKYDGRFGIHNQEWCNGYLGKGQIISEGRVHQLPLQASNVMWNVCWEAAAMLSNHVGVTVSNTNLAWNLSLFVQTDSKTSTIKKRSSYDDVEW